MTGLPEYKPHNLRIELATRRMRGPLIAGSHPRRWVGWAAGLPATVLTVSLLVVPMVWSVVLAVRARPLVVGSCLLVAVGAVGATQLVRHRTGFRLVFLPIPSGLVVAGLWMLRSALGWDGSWAYVRTLLWVLFGTVLLALALGIAWWGRDSRWSWWPLIVPFGISALVSGVAFRLIFQYLADRFGIESIAAYRVWFMAMLGSAFLWTWLGFVTGLFRAAIRAIETDPARSGELTRGGRPLPVRLYVALRPVLLIVGLAVGVAAARVFDVVLIGVPGSMQYQVDSATVHWWRLATDSDIEAGVATAYGLPLAVLVGYLGWLLQHDVRRHRTSWSSPRARAPEVAWQPAKPLRAAAVLTVSALALVPIVALIVATLRDRDGWGFGAFTRMWRDPALLRSLETTAWVAALATLVVVAAAVPVAYRLAALRSDRPAAAIAVVALVVLSVLPVQSYLGPVDTFIETYGLSGTRIPLIVLHAAAGLPIAILVLRGALLAPPGSPAADALHGLAGPGTIARRVLSTAGPALGAVAVLEFIQVWNDFVIGLLISGAGATPWSLLLWGEARQFGENSAQLAAGALMSAILPVALLLATWRRWLVPGLTGGALR
ncbi:alpha-glucoside transport system permease protein [Nocardia tenerifensis]|uniref:Alpha-glucoside transport system permease protein n=1 Tax=Nocardia tenerifensis TaxID=228006 RepID=A0A318JSE2_9NOCA|nr:hypothetical protein [Nocardia tenerifensis]PXX59124.1 alpha-glucoside transport system permease protein [Nocardia tenerifensis]